MLSSRIAAATLASLLIASVSSPALAIPIPDSNRASPPDSKHKKPAGSPSATPEKPPAPVLPLLTRVRGAPPGRADVHPMEDGQTWSMVVIGSGGLVCRGSVQIRRQESADAFGGDAAFACSDGPSSYDFHRMATFTQVGSSVVLNFSGRLSESRAPKWQAFSLFSESPTKMTGATVAGGDSTAVTLELAGR